MSLLVTGARVFIDGTGAPSREGMALLVYSGRITDVGPAATLAGRANGAEVVDATGQTLMPGMVNMHAHLRAPSPRGREESTDVMLLRGSRNARFSLASGATTIRDVGCPQRVALSVRDAIN